MGQWSTDTDLEWFRGQWEQKREVSANLDEKCELVRNTFIDSRTVGSDKDRDGGCILQVEMPGLFPQSVAKEILTKVSCRSDCGNANCDCRNVGQAEFTDEEVNKQFPIPV